VVGQRLLRYPAIRLTVDKLLLRLPLYGRLIREVIAERFSRTLGTLLENGVPLLSALTIAGESLANQAAVAAVGSAAAEVREGSRLARPLASSGIFPVRTTHLIELGEEAAQLSNMLLRAADIHEAQARRLAERFVALLVPVITIIMGLAVAGIIGSLVTAMLSLNELAA
jgi:general secretion pathway protein F